MKREPTTPLATLAARLALLASLLLTAGCIDFEQILRVQPDGSGELVQTFRFSTTFLEMTAAEGEGTSPEEMEKGLAEMEANLRAKDGELGEGTRFVSIERIPPSEGNPLPADGFIARFAFDDVTKLELSAVPAMGEGMTPDSDEDQMRFRFERNGGRSVLSAVFFDSEEAMQATMTSPTASSEESSEGADAEAAAAASEALGDEMVDMFQEMLGGLRLAVAVEVVGEILETNSPFAEGSKVTLLEIDFDRLFEQKEKLEALDQQLGEEPSLAALGLALRDVDGVTFPTTPEVTIAFQP